MMRTFFPCSKHNIPARLALAATLLFFVPARLPAQATATDQEVQVLRQEVGELKSRLAELEAKLAAFPAPSHAASATPATAHLVPSSTAPFVAAQPAPTSNQPPSKPAPFAFGDFTWMNGSSRQKSQ